MSQRNARGQVRPSSFLALLPTLLALLTAAPPTAAQKHKDEKHGFEIRIPRDFNVVPINLDEKWVVAKFLYKRALDARKGWENEAPELRVIIFPKFDPKDFAKRKLKKGGKLVALQQLQNPYKNYHDFMQQNFRGSGRGWHVAKESNTKIDELPATYKRIEVNKILQGEEGVSHIIHAWEIDYGDAIYVVHSQVLADHDAKFRRKFMNCAKSFRKILRTESVGTDFGPTTPSDEAKAKAKKSGKALSPKEIFKLRKAQLEKVKAKAIAQLPGHWKHYNKGRFLIVYNGKVDRNFLTKVHKQASKVWDWLEERFAFIGEQKAVGGIIRICNDINEASAYVDTSSKSSYSARTHEIVIWKDRDYGFDQCRSSLNQGICQRWLEDKNPRLWWALPPWLDFGLVYYIGQLELKGHKLESNPDEWDMEVLREMLREHSFKPAKTMFEAEYGKGFGSQKDSVQCIAMVHFLMTKGARVKRYKTVIPKYLQILDRRLRELYAQYDQLFEDVVDSTVKKGKKAEAERKKWVAEWKKKRDAIFKECLKECFGNWSERDWKSFDKNWKKAFKS
ncbi:MAG: hypothetical protein CSA62_07065 [Planctomycetota bacterium]|nr:MAG: hypothetical protein CSA62_07065 [Planctomycetota bacterium]